jgi:IS1 family transposase
VTEKHAGAGTRASRLIRARPEWLWTATDADTKLVPCWHVGGRDGGAAMEFIWDLASRLANRVQVTTDGHKAYLDAMDWARFSARSITRCW